MSKNSVYHRIFRERNGNGPWPCYGCGKLVRRLLVHHLDENHENNDPDNLAAMHPGCHVTLHRLGKPSSTRGRRHSATTRARMSASQRARYANGYTHSNDARERIGAAHRGRPGRRQSAATRAKIGIGSRATRLAEKLCCPGCTLITNSGALARHQKATGH